MYSKTFIPYRGYYCSPFSRWQGSLQSEHPVELVAATAKKWLATKKLDPKMFDYLILGKTVTMLHTFYSYAWVAALVGNPDISGVTISQACTTSATVVNQAALGVEWGLYSNVICLMTDRVSNGPHLIWPNPQGQGGQVVIENWVLDNFNFDPWGKQPMIQTAENVAKLTKGGVTKEECDAVTVKRYEQYADGLANDRAFQKRYMFPVEFKKGKKEVGILEADEGITPTTKEGLSGLKPIIPGGVLTFGSQTHPADGNCAIIVTTKQKAQELSADPKVEVQILSYGYSRAPKALMGMAPVPAAKMALEKAGLSIKDIKVHKSHNPFATNDIYFAREFGLDVMAMNNYGSSMVYGHPQGPTVGRVLIEMIEELVLLGGGYGMYAGCAAGDTAAALIVKVTC